MKAALALALLIEVVACTSTWADPADEVTVVPSSTTPPTTDPTAKQLVDHVTGLTGAAPLGWEQSEYGVYRPEGSSREVFTTWFLPGMNGEGAVSHVSAAFGEVALVEAGSHDGSFDFSLYTFESDDGLAMGSTLSGRAAVASTDDGAYVVVAASVDGQSAADEIFEPALDQLGEVGAADEALGAPPGDSVYLDQEASPEDRATDLVSRMSLREKLGQMTLIEQGSIEPAGVSAYVLGGVLSGGGGAPAENAPEEWSDMVDGYQGAALSTRLGVPMIYGVDSVHGHGNLDGATIFPHNIGLGAANDPDLVTRIGRATALETAATGIRWNFAPVVAVSGDIRWGRTYETYGSDPAIVAQLGAAYIEGLQRPDLADPESVIATAKHFIGDGSTGWGTSTTGDYTIDQGVTPPDETFLDEVLVPPYRAAVDAGVASVMTSFSSWGSTKVHASELMTTVLKGELGFAGFVVSDWGGVDQIDLSYATSVASAVNAGIDMNMVPYDPVRFMWSLARAVEQGEVGMERIDDAVTRILTAKFKMGLFEQPLADRSLIPSIGSDEHRTLAREAVSKTAVLLKDDDVFPIGPDVDSILVVGEAADDPGIQAGGWTISWQGSPGDVTGATSIREAIEARAPDGTEVIYSRTGRLRGEMESVEADLCIAAVGEDPYAEGVGDDGDLELVGLGVLETLSDRCGQTAMILVTGRPVIVTEYVDDWDALMAAWWFGSEADGLADLMFGDVPFSARLPVAWPRAVADLPKPADPLYPLGYGLAG